jgi:hypothetical protein
MARQNIFTGTVANDGTGDTLRQAFTKVNANFVELYDLPTGSPGGSSGQLQFNDAGAFAGMAGTSWDNTTRSLTITGATVTASAPVLNLSQTWNDGAVTFTGLLFNATDTASASGSLLLDLQVGGASRFSFDKSGVAKATSFSANGTDSPRTYALGNSTNSRGLEFFTGNNRLYYREGSSPVVGFGLNLILLAGAVQFGWTSTTPDGVLDTILTRRAAANLRLGAADAAAPIAQTLSVQSVVAGTTNTAGANLTITGSQGTGTGAGGSIVFRVAPAGASGTAQNALVDALTIAGDRSITYAGTAITVASGTRISRQAGFGGIVFNADNSITLGAAASFIVVSGNASLFGEAANTLALRNGTNAQTFNIYNTYTDASNYERLRIFAQSAGSVIIGTQKAGTGSARALELQTDGTTRLTINATNGDLTLTGAGISGPAGGTWGSPSAVEITAGGHLRWAARSRIYSSTDGAILLLDSTTTAGSSLEMLEMTAPVAPAANRVRIYAEDDGAGKTRLMALFATGSAVQIAIEP